MSGNVNVVPAKLKAAGALDVNYVRIEGGPARRRLHGQPAHHQAGHGQLLRADAQAGARQLNTNPNRHRP